jgi:hypothetical protein
LLARNETEQQLISVVAELVSRTAIFRKHFFDLIRKLYFLFQFHDQQFPTVTIRPERTLFK